MKAGKYTISDFYSHRNFEQIIVPEIQRDYVWTDVQVHGLLLDLNKQFIEYGVKKNKIKVAIREEGDSNLQSQFIEFKLRQDSSYNIGFIYAYQDDEYPGYMFLIDGQQRFTTLYLLLLAIAVKEAKQSDFIKKYILTNGKNRLDYKVRNSASDFLAHFTDYVLKNGIDAVDNVKKQYWYFSDYKQDVTIKHIQEAFNVITSFVKSSDCKFNYHYLNNFIEFWYFDTNISEQGEELYIFMNARGEAVQENENIKANLLSKLTTSSDKEYYGEKWEEWQDFFWQLKGANFNSDGSFNEFLRWLLIIKYSERRDATDPFYLNLLEGKLLSAGIEELLTIQDIEKYFQALQYLFNQFSQKAVQIQANYNSTFHLFNQMILLEWLKRGQKSKSYLSYKNSKGETIYYISQINLFKLLPVLQFIKCHLERGQIIDDNNLYRFIRYFYNISRFDNIGKAVRESIINGIELANELCNHSDRDITAINEISISKTLLTAEESNKLKLYKSLTDNVERMKIENVFWNCEDYVYSNSSINFILSCVLSDVNSVANGLSNSEYGLFLKYNDYFQALFNSITDTLRQAILTFGDYTMWDGSTPSLGGTRFTFGNNRIQWLGILEQRDKSRPVKLLLSHFVSNSIDINYLETELLKIINDFNKNIMKMPVENWWFYEFTKDKIALEYCSKKNICWIDNKNIYLLMQEKATDGTYKKLDLTNFPTRPI